MPGRGPGYRRRFSPAARQSLARYVLHVDEVAAGAGHALPREDQRGRSVHGHAVRARIRALCREARRRGGERGAERRAERDGAERRAGEAKEGQRPGLSGHR